MRRTTSALAFGLVFVVESLAFAADPAGKPHPEPRAAAPAPAAPAPRGADTTPVPRAADIAPAPRATGAVPAVDLDDEAAAGEPVPTPVVPADDDAVPAPAKPAAPTKEPAEPEPAPRATAPTTKPPQEDAETAPVVLAHDTLGGHLSIGAAASLFLPFGSLQQDHSQTDYLKPGAGFRLDVAYGVSRTVMLGLYGELDVPSGDGAWSGGKAQSLAVGPFVRYHLVQGTRFDPWMGVGAGFRRTSRGDESYTGLEFARIQLGGDYYGLSQFGVGPLVELAMGSYLSSSGVPMGSKSVYANLTVGLRFTFDGPGK